MGISGNSPLEISTAEKPNKHNIVQRSTLKERKEDKSWILRLYLVTHTKTA
jgi:hypothetical protein